MKGIRKKAFKLRLKGHSYNEITAKLGVPKSTQHTWFKGLMLSDTARKRLNVRARQGVTNGFIKRNKLQTHLAEIRAKENRKVGKNEVPELTTDNLKIIGAALYWAEGHKRLHIRDGKERMGHTIRFVNSDAEMTQIFIRFLQECLHIPAQQICLTMRLYAHINEGDARRYWTTVSGLESPKFYKTMYFVSGASKGIRPFNRLPWGTLQVEVCSTPKFHHLMGLIEGVKTRLLYGSISPLLG